MSASSAITVRCPKCGGKGKAPDLESAGRASCRRCGVPLMVGDPERGAPLDLDRIGVDLAEVTEAPAPKVQAVPGRPPREGAEFTAWYVLLILVAVFSLVGMIGGEGAVKGTAAICFAVAVAGLTVSKACRG